MHLSGGWQQEILLWLPGLVIGELIDRAGFYHRLLLITPASQMKQDFNRHLAAVQSAKVSV